MRRLFCVLRSPCLCNLIRGPLLFGKSFGHLQYSSPVQLSLLRAIGAPDAPQASILEIVNTLRKWHLRCSETRRAKKRKLSWFESKRDVSYFLSAIQISSDACLSFYQVPRFSGFAHDVRSDRSETNLLLRGACGFPIRVAGWDLASHTTRWRINCRLFNLHESLFWSFELIVEFNEINS